MVAGIKVNPHEALGLVLGLHHVDLDYLLLAAEDHDKF